MYSWNSCLKDSVVRTDDLDFDVAPPELNMYELFEGENQSNDDNDNDNSFLADFRN